MTTYKPGDVVLVKFPFTTGAGAKLRPALVLLDAGDADLLVARVTTQPSFTPFDVAVVGWRQAGLLAPSNVRLHKLATIEKSDIHRTIGRLESNDRQSVAGSLRRVLDQW